MVVPWSLPDDQQNDPSESKPKLDQILKTKVRQMCNLEYVQKCLWVLIKCLVRYLHVSQPIDL